ncbi:sodium-dependent noradrenaline transporter-like [Hyposmocoma kahamanoa]|uniref:sodium-dependent noradrenaline transporter-like n=1 Tax=Hyposmocoma kahamanoa TaxID=1477025 RepID=UPI000E6D7897|nr:sodium-dependent noradrenaline transporter-like [Hyposmocoma kahamanoa]
MDETYLSRKTYILLLIYLSTSVGNLVNQANTAVTNGTIGYLVWYFLASVFVGIPLAYMELSLGQFTRRNVIDIWKIRPCLSHIGYIVVIWQIIILVYNHTVVTYLMQYFLVSFQKPIPYHTCGQWSYQNCNIIEKNYTVYWVCVRGKQKRMDFCNNIYTTYPEYQYYRSNAMQTQENAISLNWRIYLTSGLVLVVVYFHNFKKLNSAKWFLIPFALYPYMGYFYLFVGSMQQKGLIQKYEDALDTGLQKFRRSGRITQIIHQMIYGLGLGNGVMINISSKAAFRTPCYVNAVLSVLISLFFTIVAVFTTALMSCPIEYKSINPILSLPMSFTFEKVPMMLYEYDSNEYFLITNYSAQTMLGITTDIVIFFSLLEILTKKVPFARHVVATGYYRIMNIVSTFIVITQCFCFILWYGFERFSEDVHFMQGIKPNNYLKLSWASAIFVLVYVIFSELYFVMKNPRGVGDKIGFFTLVTFVVLVVSLTGIKLLVAALKSKQAFWKAIEIDPSWGPKNKLLRRSRALFSAQAMTKEYIYRQYQLQAGIQERQKRANLRVNYGDELSTN